MSQWASCTKAKICKERWTSIILYVMSHPGSNPGATLWPLSMAIYGIFPFLWARPTSAFYRVICYSAYCKKTESSDVLSQLLLILTCNWSIAKPHCARQLVQVITMDLNVICKDSVALNISKPHSKQILVLNAVWVMLPKESNRML